MNADSVFRLIFLAAFLVMTSIRVYYQAKISRDTARFNFKEGAVSLIFGGTAAIVTIVFGAEYLFFPGTFAFAYALPYPDAIRWLGVAVLAAGIGLLDASHHYLGKSFSSFVGSKDNHVLAQSGPYRWIRHPIYLAFLLSYISGGLVAGNWVLTFVSAALYAVLVAIRMGKEEKLLTEIFGPEYIAYMQRTGRLLPKV